MRIYTKGNVEVQNIKVGDVHYEFEFGLCIKSTVITNPTRDDNGLWSWQSVGSDGQTINYAVSEGHSHYGPNLYDYIAYANCKML